MNKLFVQIFTEKIYTNVDLEWEQSKMVLTLVEIVMRLLSLSLSLKFQI